MSGHEIERQTELIPNVLQWEGHFSISHWFFIYLFFLHKGCNTWKCNDKRFQSQNEILLEAIMLENISVFKVRGQQVCSVKLQDCPLSTFIDCALSPPEALTHWLMKSRLQAEISLTFSSNCHGRKPTNLISFFFSPREHLMGAQILLPQQSRWLPPPRVPPSLLLSLFICVSLSCFCSAATEQKPKPPSRGSKVTVKGDPAAPGARMWWGVDTHTSGWK